MVSNRRSFLSEVMSIDAWYQPFKMDDGKSAVYVDVTFHEGRIGGRIEEMPFTFKVALKRALLHISLEHPLRLDRSTVARGVPANESDFNLLMAARSKVKDNPEIGGVLEVGRIASTINESMGASHQDKQRERISFLQTIPKISVTPRPGGNSQYAWDLQPSYQEFLDGQPWHPSEEPRLQVKGLLKSLKIDPSIRVTLTCAFEDIHISDFTPKKEGFLEKVRLKARNEMSEAAAIQFLKHTLKDLNLEVGALDNKFSDLIIADILAWQE